MRIVFIGTVEFSLQMLTALVEKNVDIGGVITTKDSGFNSDYANLTPLCRLHNIPVLMTLDVNDISTLNWIKNHNPDVIFCMGWSRLIKKELLSIPRLGVIGYHPSALPQNRGRHPLIWALVLGLKKTASTFFVMDERADSGDILSQEDIIIDVDDDANTLYKKMIQIAAEQLLNLVTSLRKECYQKCPQDHSKANLWRKRGIKDGEIDWRMSAMAIHNLVRGLTRPYIGAHFLNNGQEYKVWKTKVVNCQK